MKKIIVLLLLILFLSVIPLPIKDAVSTSIERNWLIQTVDSTSNVGQYSSIALDSFDRPHISYYDATNENLKYAKWIGSNWITQVIDSDHNAGLWTSIALDSYDRPYISYSTVIGDYSYLYCAKRIGGVWSKERLPYFSGMYGSPYDIGTSIAIDRLNRIYISYSSRYYSSYWYGGWTDYRLEIAKWDGYWSREVVDKVSGSNMWWASIAIDDYNRPHISYYDAGEGDLKYARWTGSCWDIQTVDYTGNVGLCTSIAIDNYNRPHISYYDQTHGTLKYAKWTGSSWHIETVDDAYWVGGYSSIAIDNYNRPHISYCDCANKDLKYAKWTGSKWDVQTVDSTGDVGLWTSIALDSHDRAHISYFDETNTNLKYARELNNKPTVTIDNPIDGENVSGMVTIKGTARDIDGNYTIQKVEVKIDDGAWQTADGTTLWEYSCNFTSVGYGSHTIRARAWDGEEYSNEVLVNVFVNYTYLSTSIDPSGGGDISLNPAGGIYDYGTVVTVTAVPNEGYEFSYWSGNASGTNPTIQITMDSNKNIVAHFAPINYPPNKPYSPYPPNNATNVAITTTLSWQCSDADGDTLTYDIYFGTGSNPPKVVSNITTNFYSPGTLQYSTTYYWKVVAWDEHGAKNSSDVWHFTTEAYTPPPPPPNHHPISGIYFYFYFLYGFISIFVTCCSLNHYSAIYSRFSTWVSYGNNWMMIWWRRWRCICFCCKMPYIATIFGSMFIPCNHFPVISC